MIHAPPDATDLFIHAHKIDDVYPLEAMRLYRRAIHLNPMFDAAMANLGRLYFLRGELGAAETWWLRALEVDPKHAETLYNMGYLRLTQGAITGAIAYFRKSLETDKDFTDAHYNLAVALGEDGQTDEARKSWRRYLQLGGEFRKEALMLLGLRVLKGGKS